MICHNPSFPDHLYLELLANLGDMSDSLVVTAEYGDLVVYGEAGNDTITWLPSGDLAANVRYRESFFSGAAMAMTPSRPAPGSITSKAALELTRFSQVAVATSSMEGLIPTRYSVAVDMTPSRAAAVTTS